MIELNHISAEQRVPEETTDGRVRVCTEDKDKEQFSACISPIKRAFQPVQSPQVVKYGTTMFPANISQIVRQSVNETVN